MPAGVLTLQPAACKGSIGTDLLVWRKRQLMQCTGTCLALEYMQYAAHSNQAWLAFNIKTFAKWFEDAMVSQALNTSKAPL